MPTQDVNATLQVESGSGLVNLQDPNPTLQAILALLAERPDTVTVQRVAHGALSGERVVCPLDSGEVIYGDDGDLTQINRPMWLTTGAWAPSALATLTAYGLVTESGWTWTPGLPLFLEDNGFMSQTPPTSATAAFSLQVGTAVTATSIFFNPSAPLEL